jgi:pimeloyl-ACP methyl ester carboxylesterase
MPYVQVKNLEMFYEKMGAGETVLFLHSSYSRGILAFASQMLDFQKKFTCYFPDFRGHGRTRCESLEWSTPQIADDVIEFMNKWNISTAHLVGYKRHKIGVVTRSFQRNESAVFNARHYLLLESMTPL